MTEVTDKAKRLSEVKYHGDYIFAFDYIKDRELIERKLKIWRKYCSKSTKLYLLCAYESQDIQDIINSLFIITFATLVLYCATFPPNIPL